MVKKLRGFGLLAAITLAAVAPASLISTEVVGADFGHVGDPSVFTLSNASLVSTSTRSVGSAATIQFNAYRSTLGQYTSNSVDWSPYQMASMILTNHESRDVNFRFIVQVRPDLSDYTGSWNAGLRIPAGQTRRFVFHLNYPDPRRFGMKIMPPPVSEPSVNVRLDSQQRDFSTVYHWRLSSQESAPTTVTLADFRLMSWDLSFWGMVDQYGQFTRRYWQDKIVAEEDFAARRANEENDLASRPVTGEPFGTKNLPGFTATGRWGVARNGNGKAYLVTPEGRPFWSLGATSIAEGIHTVVEGRLGYFEELPSQSGSFGSLYRSMPTQSGSRLCYSFHQQNLMLKYGTNYRSTWLDTVRRRLASWGVNTVGMQSDDALMDGSLPYTLLLKTSSYPTRMATKYIQWETLPDPYAADFQSWATNEFAKVLPSHNGKWGFMGVFVDNEMSWGNSTSTERLYNVALGALNSPSTQPAKAAFLRLLSKKYRTITKLNKAWGTSFISWDAMKSLANFYPKSMSPSMQADFNAFQVNYAEYYYGKVREALRANDCTGLYLGSRFASYTPDALAGAAPYVDIYSFNVYRFSADTQWNEFASLSKPVLISEWCITAQDRGTFGGLLTESSSHAERAQAMRDWLGAAVQHPNVVGAHWFRYSDEPATGRWSDGENFGMGLVDVADTPYKESINVFRDFSARLYEIRG